MKTNKFTKEAYKAYIKSLFEACCTLKPSLSESVESILTKLAKSSGRSSEEIKDDIKRVITMKGAIDRLIDKEAAILFPVTI